MGFYPGSPAPDLPVTNLVNYDRGTRTTACTSDGIWIAILWVDNHGAPAGAGRVNVYKCADGVTWQYLFSHDSLEPNGPKYSFCLDNSDNIHYVEWDEDSENAYYERWNRGSSSIWDGTHTEEMTTLAPGGLTGRIDICMLDNDKVCVVGTRAYNLVDEMIFVIRNASGTWTTPQIIAMNSQRPSNVAPVPLDAIFHGYISVAEDRTATASNLKRFAILVNPADQCYWYIYAFEINATTGAIVQQKLMQNRAFGGSASRYSTGMIFSTDTNEWTVGAIIGTGTATKVWASRFTWNGFTYPETGLNTTSKNNGLLYHASKSVQYFADRIFFSMADAYLDFYFVLNHFARFDAGSNKIFISPRFYAEMWAQEEISMLYHGNAKNFDAAKNVFNFVLYSAISRTPGPFISWRSRMEIFTHIPENGVVAPANGSTVATDLPVLNTAVALAETDPRVKGGWDLSTASNFSQNFRRITLPDTAFQGSGNTFTTVPNQAELYQTTWYIRPFFTDEFGTDSFPGPVTSFIVSHPPTTTNQEPVGNVVIKWDVAGNQLKWSFYDTSPTDYQTAYQVQVQNNSTGASVLDSNKVTSTDKTYNAVIPSGSLGATLRWRVRTWDSDDVAGSYSNWFLFRPFQAPTLAFPNPGGISSPVPTFAWTYTAGTAGAQTHIRLVINEYATGFNVYDSGKIAWTTSTFTLPRPVLTKDVRYNVILTTYDSVGLSASQEWQNLLTSWVGPSQPYFTVNTDYYDSDGYIQIAWNNTLLDPNFTTWRVYRRDEENPDWVLVGENSDISGSVDLLDFLAPANLTVDYTVVQVKVFAGSEASMEIESDIDTHWIVTPPGTKYWMVEEGFQAQPSTILTTTEYVKTPIENVTADSFTEKYESTIHNVPERGNKRDVGQRWGYDGSMTVQLYGLGGLTARQERKRLELLRQQRRKVWLRSPFGDVWQITLGEVTVDRMAGVGTNEYSTVTIPYTEVSSS